MAEAVLFNVARSILKKLGSLALNEIGLLWGLKDEIEKLKHTVQTISSVLLDAEKQYQVSNQVKDWLDALRDVVYDVDDLLDDISTMALRRKAISGNVRTKEVKLFFSSSNRVAYGLKMAHKIKDVRARLEEIKDVRKFHLNQNDVEPTVIDHDRETHSSPPKVIIGRDDDKKEIISRLLANHGSDVMVVPIIGLGGLGKTTLAQLVYNDETVKENFDLKVWICVSDVFDIKSIIEKMIECIGGGESIRNLGIEVLKIQLHKIVEMKKYLIVLDDVWNEDREKWVRFSDLMVGGAPGSRILITTRSNVVADITRTSLSYELGGLSDMESWNLFQAMAFKHGQAPNEEFKKLGKEIAIKCGGLPLAIRTIGSFLYTKTKESEWVDFKDKEFMKLDAKKDIIETLKLSYNHLPSNLKHCFAYCSLFPKDYTFDVYELTSYWKSQDYVDSENEGTLSGLDCVKYLIQRCFLQMENEGEYDKIEKCKMHDFMHDLATSVAGEEVKMLTHENGSGTVVTRTTRHISMHVVSDKIKWQDVSPVFQGKKARTLIVQSQRLWEKIVIGEDWLSIILAELKYLRVLVMKDCIFKTLPSFIDKLKHLRQLNLSGNWKIEMLPDCVTRLVNLEVVNLNKCGNLRQLPKNMKKLENLVKLELKGCDKLEEMPQGIGQLTFLEVLSQFCLSQKKGSGALDELQNLSNLRRKLKLLNLQYAKRGDCEAANLKGKPHLQSLILDWGKHEVEEIINIEEILLEALQPHVNLRVLKLWHYGGVGFPRWVSSHENLHRIEFYHCKKCKSLPLIYGLPKLQHLHVSGLDELEYLIDDNRNTKGTCFFPKLESLTLWNCPKLKGWWSMTSSTTTEQLPCLSELDIWYCPNLKGWMPQLPSINTVILKNIGVSLLEETLKQARPQASIVTSSGTTATTATLFPLKSLTIVIIKDIGDMQEEALQSLASLKSIEFGYLRDIRILSQWFRHLTSLENLSFCEVENACFQLLEESNAGLFQCLRSLRSLCFVICREMKALPEGLGDLLSLEQLSIRACVQLESLPVAMGKLTSLKLLKIWKCPKLSERCRINQGEYWHLISHIPNIIVDDKWVQRDGHYQL